MIRVEQNTRVPTDMYGANTTVPFDAGSARMTHSGDHLLVRTCHEMYKSATEIIIRLMLPLKLICRQ